MMHALVFDVRYYFTSIVANRLMDTTWSPKSFWNLLHQSGEFPAEKVRGNTFYLHGNIGWCPRQWDSDKQVNVVRLNVDLNAFTVDVGENISNNHFASSANFINQNLPVILCMEDHMVVHQAHRFFCPVLKAFRFHGY
jgi:hypothetical protein